MMKITLRKANAIQAAINSAIGDMREETQVSVNEFQTPAEEIEKARTAFWEFVGERGLMIDALYEIRNKVAEANATAGVNALLGEVAKVERNLNFYDSYSDQPVMADQKVIDGQHEKLKTRPVDAQSRYAPSTLTVSIFNDMEVKGFRAEAGKLKKERNAMKDKLLELNVSTKIELSEEAVAILSKFNIV